MNGRKSELSDRINLEYYKDRISEKLKTGSLVGEVFKIDGKNYKITDGNLDSTFEKIEKLKQDILNNLKK